MNVIIAIVLTAIVVWVGRPVIGRAKLRHNLSQDLANSMKVYSITSVANELVLRVSEGDSEAFEQLMEVGGRARAVWRTIENDRVRDLAHGFVIDAYAKCGAEDMAWNLFDIMDEGVVKSEIKRMHPTLGNAEF